MEITKDDIKKLSDIKSAESYLDFLIGEFSRIKGLIEDSSLKTLEIFIDADKLLNKNRKNTGVSYQLISKTKLDRILTQMSQKNDIDRKRLGELNRLHSLIIILESKIHLLK